MLQTRHTRRTTPPPGPESVKFAFSRPPVGVSTAGSNYPKSSRQSLRRIAPRRHPSLMDG